MVVVVNEDGRDMGEPGPPQLSVHGTDTSVLQISEEERNQYVWARWLSTLLQDSTDPYT